MPAVCHPRGRGQGGTRPCPPAVPACRPCLPPLPAVPACRPCLTVSPAAVGLLLLDDVHGGLLGTGARTVDARVAAGHLRVGVLVGALVGSYEPTRPPVAHLGVADEVVLGGDGVRVVAADALVIEVVQSALVLGGSGSN